MPVNWDLTMAARVLMFGVIIGALAAGIAASMVILRLARWRRLGDTEVEHKRAAWRAAAGSEYACPKCDLGDHANCLGLACECRRCGRHPMQMGGRIRW